MDNQKQAESENVTSFDIRLDAEDLYEAIYSAVFNGIRDALANIESRDNSGECHMDVKLP